MIMNKNGNNAWEPVRNGDTYCSPACGRGCKYNDYQATLNKANDVARIMGHGWTAKVWENLGWHWEVISSGKNIHIKPSNYKGLDNRYRANISERGSAGILFSSDVHTNPHYAVAEVVGKLEKKIKELQSLRGF